MNQSKVTIAIGGDTVPTCSNEDYLIDGRESSVFNGVEKELSSTDYAIINLECPFTDHEQEIKKVGPCLKAKPDTIHGLVKAGVNIFSLANNHIMDFGPKGLEDTLCQIEKTKALSVGAGKNLDAARRTLFLEKNGYQLAVLSVAEHEFSIAEENTPGANPFDPFDTIEDIQRAKRTADAVIVLYHGGIEHYRLPSPSLQRVCRKMVENGANFVICQHSHCIGAYENYLDGYIVYGQGNLLFDYREDEMWQDGLLLKLSFDNTGYCLDFIPVVKKGYAVDLAMGEAKAKILSALNERSVKIADRAFIDQEWVKFSRSRTFFYLQTFFGFPELLRRVDNRIGNLLTRSLIHEDDLRLLYSFLTCEAHLDVLKTILKENHLKRK